MEEKWSLRDIEDADYELLLELFMSEDVPVKEEKQDATSFFASLLSPQDLSRAKGEIE